MLGGWCWEAVVVRTGVPDQLEQLRGGVGERDGRERGGAGHQPGGDGRTAPGSRTPPALRIAAELPRSWSVHYHTCKEHHGSPTEQNKIICQLHTVTNIYILFGKISLTSNILTVLLGQSTSLRTKALCGKKAFQLNCNFPACHNRCGWGWGRGSKWTSFNPSIWWGGQRCYLWHYG